MHLVFCGVPQYQCDGSHNLDAIFFRHRGKLLTHMLVEHRPVVAEFFHGFHAPTLNQADRFRDHVLIPDLQS
jgi:hypothetical protein